MRKTVLIVEDDKDTRSIFETALVEHGYLVMVAKQGAEGVHMARRFRPDLILLDIRMPVMDGWQAVKYLRAFPTTRSIPICGISAYKPEDDEMAQIQAIEFDCFLSKPIEPKDLIRGVDALIGPPQSRSSQK